MAEIQLIKGAANGNPSDSLPIMYDKVNKNTENINNQVVNHEGRLGTAEATVSDQGTRLVAAETEIVDHEGRIDTAEVAVTDHGIRITEAESGLVEQQAQIDTLVLNGDSSPAAAQAAVDAAGHDYGNLKVRLDTEHTAVSTQLADTQTLENFEVRSNRRAISPLIVFTLDDGGIHDYQTVFPILSAHGFVASSGIITSQVDNPSQPYSMSLATIKELQNVHGWEIVSHAVTDVNLTTLTDSQVEAQLRDSKDFLLDNNLIVRNFFLPRGMYNDTIKRIARKYYRSVRISGAASTGAIVNISPFDMYQVDCRFFGDSDGTDPNIDPASGARYDTVDYFKYYIDQAISLNGVLIIGMHGNNIATNNRQTDLGAICEYIESKGISVVTYNEMLNRVGNIVDAPNFKVGAGGKIGGKYGKIKNGDFNEIINTTPIQNIDNGYVTVSPLGNSSGLPSDTGGTMISVKSDNSASRAFQLIKTFGKEKGLHYRDFTDTEVSNWQRLDNVHVVDNLPFGHTVNDLRLGALTVGYIFGGAPAAGYPDGVAGLLIANRYSSNTASVRESFFKINGGDEYERYWDSSINAWSPFVRKFSVKQLSANAVTLTDSINVYPNGVSYTQISSAHATTHGFPGNSAGNLETHRTGNSGYIYQYYHIYDTVDIYKRVYKSNNTWSAFAKINI